MFITYRNPHSYSVMENKFGPYISNLKLHDALFDFEAINSNIINIQRITHKLYCYLHQINFDILLDFCEKQ